MSVAGYVRARVPGCGIADCGCVAASASWLCGATPVYALEAPRSYRQRMPCTHPAEDLVRVWHPASRAYRTDRLLCVLCGDVLWLPRPAGTAGPSPRSLSHT